MYLKYNIDYDKKSYSIVHTPTLNYLQLPFHIEVMGHVYARSNYYTQRSNLDSYLLVVTLDGEGYLKYRNKKVTIRKNQAFFIDCREYQDYGTAEAGYWEMLWFHIIGTAVPSYFEMINGRSIKVDKLSET